MEHPANIQQADQDVEPKPTHHPKILFENFAESENTLYICQIMSRRKYVKYLWK
jgi:hypothetical protein